MRSTRAAPVLLTLFILVAGCVGESTDPMGPESSEASGAPRAAADQEQGKRSEPIEGRYIVLFQEGISDPSALAAGMAASQGMAIRRTYTHALQGFVADVPTQAVEQVLDALSRNPNVRSVEQDKLWYIDTEWFGSGDVQLLPNAPSALSATAQSETDVSLSWTDNSGDENKFEIQRCEGSGCSSFSAIGEVKSNVTSFADGGLSAGTEYCYRVLAVSGRGRNATYSPPSNVDCATTQGTPPEPPPDDRPTDLSASPLSDSEIGLTWTDNSAEDGFSVERCEGAACGSFQEIAQTGPDVSSFSDSGLSADTEYCYRVRGYDRKGKKYTYTEYSLESCATTLAPPPPPATDPPSGLAAVAASSSAIDLSWTDNSDETAFEIERCQGAGCSDWAKIDETAADATTYSDATGLTADTEYCYRVRGLLDPTPTDWSNVDCATTDPAGGGSGSRFVEDSFEDSGGTNLQSHTGEAGASWTRHPDASWDALFSGDGSEVYSDVRATYYASGTPPGTDYRTAAHARFHTASDFNVRYVFVTGRMDETAGTMYMFGFVFAGVNRWELKKLVAGTETLLASSTGHPPSAGDMPLIDLRMNGTQIEGYVDGALVASATDASITGPGRAGLRMQGGNGEQASLLDFEATTLDLAPPPPAPSTDPPSGLSAVATSSSAIALGWTDNSDETAFDVERCQGAGCSDFAWIAQVGANVTTYADAGGLSPSTEYCYRVRGVLDPTPTIWSNVDCATTLSDGGGGSRFVLDSFEDVGGTSLPAHTGETGATWTRHSEARWDATFTASGSEIFGDVRATHFASGTPPGPDYRAAGHARFYSAGDGTVDYVFVTGRMDESAATMYMFGFVYAGVNRWELKKMVGGTETLLASSSERLPSAGDTPLIDLRMSGTLIEGYVDGVLVASATDAGIAGPGRAGLRIEGGDGDWASLMDFEATTLDLAPPPPPPSTDPPTGMGAIALSSGDIRIHWTDNSDETAFEIERCEGPGCSNFGWTGEVGEDVTTFTDTGLTAGTEYCYRVRGLVGTDQTPWSDVVCETSRESTAGNCPDTGNHDDLAQLWGIQSIRANLNPVWLGTQAEGECAIQGFYFGLDSGVDSDHPDLNVIEVVDFVGDGSGGEDGHGHGTHTAGSAAALDGNGGVVGVAPGAPVYGFKVCGDDGSCELSAILAAIDEVTARKLANPSQPMVANMSLGGDPSPSMDEAIRSSINTGVVYALAAGNGWLGACLIPARSENVSPAMVGDDNIAPDGSSTGDDAPLNGAITTTSHNENLADDDCNYGAPVTVASPGVNITSSYKDGGYATTSGTSMATPHTAGAALLYLQADPSATPAEVEAAIVSLLKPWTTDDTPNASGRLDVGDL